MAVPKKRLAVLISGRGSNLHSILEACAQGRIAGEVVQVISNRPAAGGLAYARQAGVAHQVIDHQQYAGRESFDTALAAALNQAKAHWIVLAGFMRILTPAFVEQFQAQLLNIHPSLLPEFRGLHTHARVLAAGHAEHGASVHRVTPDLDSGPVIMQARVPVCPGDDPERLAVRVQKVEHRLYPTVLDLLCSERLILQPDGGMLLDEQSLQQPLLLPPCAEVVCP